VLAGTRILLEQRPRAGRMAGLWELPTRENVDPEGHPTGLFPTEFADRHLRVTHAEPLLEVRHSITRHRIRAVVLRGVTGAGARPGERFGWFERGGVREVALTGMARKVTDWLECASPTNVGE
jgi:adenine-specific DNA glycosylase